MFLDHDGLLVCVRCCVSTLCLLHIDGEASGTGLLLLVALCSSVTGILCEVAMRDYVHRLYLQAKKKDLFDACLLLIGWSCSSLAGRWPG